MSGFTARNVPDQSGRCFVVTGANTGVGFEITKALAARGARVIMACRSHAKAEAASRRIGADVLDADLHFVELDLADLDSVRRAAESLAREPRIDVLINNAGVMIPPLTRTKQGFELQFGVNHLAPFALTALLLPKLAEQADSRVVVTSSLSHRQGEIDWDDLNAERSYKRNKRYSDSKLANLLFVHELDRRLRASNSPVKAVACHPGIASTELGRHAGVFKVLLAAGGRLFNDAAKGAWPALQAATGPIEPGAYYGPQRMMEAAGPSAQASRTDASRDPELARRLWDKSIEMTGIDPKLPPV